MFLSNVPTRKYIDTNFIRCDAYIHLRFSNMTALFPRQHFIQIVLIFFFFWLKKRFSIKNSHIMVYAKPPVEHVVFCDFRKQRNNRKLIIFTKINNIIH